MFFEKGWCFLRFEAEVVGFFVCRSQSVSDPLAENFLYGVCGFSCHKL